MHIKWILYGSKSGKSRRIEQWKICYKREMRKGNNFMHSVWCQKQFICRISLCDFLWLCKKQYFFSLFFCISFIKFRRSLHNHASRRSNKKLKFQFLTLIADKRSGEQTFLLFALVARCFSLFLYLFHNQLLCPWLQLLMLSSLIAKNSQPNKIR